MVRLRRASAAGLAIACLLIGGRAAARSLGAPADATFQLVTMAREGSTYRSVALGTAFFIDPDGTALTNGHVVYMFRENPSRFWLLALVGREFYTVSVICARAPAYDPKTGLADVGRDVAEIKLGPSRFPVTRLRYARDGPEYAAHMTTLPPFPALTLGSDPPPGLTITIVGYGRPQEEFPPAFGMRWTSTGTVDRLGEAPDGTSVFRVVSANRPRPGDSGSPVLDRAGRVVGMWTWNEPDNLAFGMAIGSSALTQPCGSHGRLPAARARGE